MASASTIEALSELYKRVYSEEGLDSIEIRLRTWADLIATKPFVKGYLVGDAFFPFEEEKVVENEFGPVVP